MTDKAYEIPWNCQYNGYQRALLSMVYKFRVLATRKAGVSVNELAEE